MVCLRFVSCNELLVLFRGFFFCFPGTTAYLTEVGAGVLSSVKEAPFSHCVQTEGLGTKISYGFGDLTFLL
jgi:hypothetical protein